MAMHFTAANQPSRVIRADVAKQKWIRGSNEKWDLWMDLTALPDGATRVTNLNSATRRCWSTGVQERSEVLACALFTVVVGPLLNVPRHQRERGGALRQLATRSFAHSRNPRWSCHIVNTFRTQKDKRTLQDLTAYVYEYSSYQVEVFLPS